LSPLLSLPSPLLFSFLLVRRGEQNGSRALIFKFFADASLGERRA
jgi:hypothetical protein